MNKKHLLLPLVLSLFIPFFAHASIVDTSLNPNVAPGLVTYLADNGWPTPQYDPTAPNLSSPLPASQTIFGQNDPIRVSQSISLADLNQITDDNGESAWDLDSLIWVVDWWAPDNTLIGSNVVSYAWSDLADDILDGNTQISFYTDLYVPQNNSPLELGEWFVGSYFEANAPYRSTANFWVVPEPITFLLFASGLLILIAPKIFARVK